MGVPLIGLEVGDRVTDTADAVVAVGDCIHTLTGLPDDFAELIITSPPYNLGKPYEETTEFKTYLDGLWDVMKECVRVLSPTGSLCWQVGNYVENSEVFPLDIFVYPLFKTLELKLRNRIVWHFGHGLHARKRFSGRYEVLLWFTKGDDYTFNLDDVRIPSKYPGKRHFKGDKLGQLSGNPLGKNPTDFWQVLEQDWDSMVWDIPNVKSNHPEKTEHPCQFPIELVERCVLALTHENDWVIDPYAGVGSAVLASLMHGRRAIGCEMDAGYANIMRSRIEQLETGKLRHRRLGTPIYQPTGKDKVSQAPPEWQVLNGHNGHAE